jgi:3-keto-5-aminohexanoate cleavage enzyme
MDALIISVGINGGELTREDTPHLPLSSEEIADSVEEAWEAGAAAAHIHVRDDEGRPSHDVNLYRDVVDRIRKRCDIIINLTTDIRRHEDGDFDVLRLEPELASFPGGSVNYGDGVLLATAPVLRHLAGAMRASRVRPELEIFHDGMVGLCRQLAEEGLLPEPHYYQLCLGLRGGAPADPRTLLHLLEMIPHDSPWSVVGLGSAGVPMAMMAIMLGGHVRVGLEDQIEYLPGELAVSNAQLVARIVRIAHECGRGIATPDDARHILHLTRGQTPSLT